MARYQHSKGSVLTFTLSILVIIAILISAITMAIAFDAQYKIKKTKQQFVFIEMETTAYRILNDMVINENTDVFLTYEDEKFIVTNADITTLGTVTFVSFDVRLDSVNFFLKVAVELDGNFEYAIKAWGKDYD